MGAFFHGLSQKHAKRAAEIEAIFAAVQKSQAVIEFDMSGKILTANDAFLNAMGYALSDIQGRHHSLFVTPAYAESPEYQAFWEGLKRGAFQSGEFTRLGKDGRKVYIQAAYNPILGPDGRPFKVVKFAYDITARKLHDLDMDGQVRAIHRSQAVIEFDMDGNILDANDHFLKIMGYDRLEEIQGQNHRMCVDPEYGASAEYRAFWDKLRRGESIAAQFRRVGKDGRDLYIQAIYTPILDLDGKPLKVIKFATDVTERVLRDSDYAGQIAAINRGQAVIEFNLDGIILTANENFLQTVGYRLDEIVGQHHSLFVDPKEKASPAYAEFWKRLGRGEFIAGEHRRFGKNGREIYLQATYNAIFGLDGKPFKVVKYATDITERMKARMRNVELSASLQELAAAVEQMVASGGEIASTMDQSRATSEQAAARVVEADQSTQKLVQAAQSMNGILDIISDITSQINLLALNATIESARAGEAGRGFAVVATEVKTLAAQAKRATDQIASEINGVRAISGEVVASLDAIRAAVDQVQGYVLTTVGAIEEQNATSQDMARNMQTASKEAQSIIGAAA